MRLVIFCPSGILPDQLTCFLSLRSSEVIYIRTEKALRSLLRYWPEAVVISTERPAVYAEQWFCVCRDHPLTVVLCVVPFFWPPDVSVSGVLKNLKILKPGIPGAIFMEMVNTSVRFSEHGARGGDSAMESFAAFVQEVNRRTKERLMSDRFPEQLRKVLSYCLAGYSRENIARSVGTGVRQVWIAEQALKQRWGIPDTLTLPEALLLSVHDSNEFHSTPEKRMQWHCVGT